MFKTCLDIFWIDFGHFWKFENFLTFLKIFEDPTLHGLLGNLILKNWPQNTFGHLRTILDNFRTLKSSWFFSWIFSEYVPRFLSPENRFQIVSVQKTEHIVLSSGNWTHNFKSRKSGKGLRILTVAWMQKECLLSIVSENWTLIFKSRKSEKPCMDYWAKKIGKIAIKHVQNTFGHFWDRFWAFLEFWIFFLFFRKLSMNPWNNEQKNFSKKIAPRHVWTLGNVFRHFRNFERFLIFFMNYF